MKIKILLICSAGTSTSLVVKKMQDEAKERGLDAIIEAKASMDAKLVGGEWDVLLLGPQMKYEEKTFKNLFPEKPVDVIPAIHYGRLNGAAVLDMALEMKK